MTILHIITRLILGGAQENTLITCAAQVRAGHRVILAYGPIYGPEGTLLPQAKDIGVETVELPALRRAVLPIHDFSAYREMRQLIQQVKPDVVHTHSSKAGILGRAAAWAEHVPVVIHTVHGLAFHDHQPNWLHRFYVRLERYAAKRCHHMIALTYAMVDAMVYERIAPEEKFTVIPSGIDLDAYDVAPGRRAQEREAIRQKLNIPADAPVVGLLARLDPLKGQDDLLDALLILRERYPNVRILFVGDGWHRKHLEQRVKEKQLEQYVIFAGLVPSEQVSSYLAAMDVNTLPSYQEGQARTLLQALMARTPIVAYDAGGMPEVCIDQQTGRLVATGDVQALAQAIIETLEQPEQTQAMLTRGVEHVKANFDQRVMVQQIQAVYDRYLAIASEV